MPKLPDLVADYIAAQPADQQPALREIYAMLAKAYPKARLELYATGAGAVPIFKDGETWLGGFAQRKKGPMVYVMDQEVIAKYKPQLGTLADGKACVLYKTTKTLDAAALKSLFETMIAETAAKRK
jgi:uncharacterized protein YdhG (YjbR/CyaY superfamily)